MDNNKVKKSVKKSGGSNRGAGRKPIYSDIMVKITIRLPQYQIDHCQKKGGDQVSLIRDLLEKDITDERSD